MTSPSRHVVDDAAATAATVPALDREPRPGWPLWQRIVFRFVLVYYVLGVLPGPLLYLLGPIHEGLDAVGLDMQARPWKWPGKWAVELGKVEKGWQDVTTWLDERELTPYEVIHQLTGSGDTGHAFAKLLVVAIASLLVTALWSMVRSAPRGYPRLGRWLHLVVRFDLAFTMLGYGAAKFYGGQFGDLGLMRLTQEIGDTSPMGLVGTFMQASKPYELFGGGCEVLAGLLLFHRRTALLGAVVAIGTLMNICALNWLCGVPVKLYSAHLLLCAVLLLAPYRARLWALFVSNRPSQPVDLAVVKATWARWMLLVVGSAWVLGWLWSQHVQGMAPKPWLVGREKSALYGVWNVDRLLFDGKPVPTSDSSRWRFLAIDRGKLAWVREASGQQWFFDFEWDESTGNATVTPRGGAAGSAPLEWKCEQGRSVVPVDVPLLLRNEDRRRKVDGERRTLVVTGKWGTKDFEAHLVEKSFRLQAGFRLRQELPEGW